MGIKPDTWIRKMAEEGMITPFEDNNYNHHKTREISWGISSFGYDIRVSNEFQLFKPAVGGIVNPKDFDPSLLEVMTTDVCLIPAHGFALARSVEYFKIPRNVMTVCLGKSTYARCGIIVNITALEPEWEGHVTIEISNTTPVPVMIYAFEGIAQVLFFEAEEDCEISYAEKKGKYQGQTGITLAK